MNVWVRIGVYAIQHCSVCHKQTKHNLLTDGQGDNFIQCSICRQLEIETLNMIESDGEVQ